jgi:hypothetical protein
MQCIPSPPPPPRLVRLAKSLHPTRYVLGPSERSPLRFIGENLVEQVLMVAGQLGPLTQALRHAQHLPAGLPIKNPPKKTQKTHLKKPTKNVFLGFF